MKIEKITWNSCVRDTIKERHIIFNNNKYLTVYLTFVSNESRLNSVKLTSHERLGFIWTKIIDTN